MKRVLAVLCISLAIAACDKDRPTDRPAPPGRDGPGSGGDGPAPPGSGGDGPAPPGSGGGQVQPITGNERIGWQQLAATPAELSTFRYNIYVDNVPIELQGVACDATATSTGFACSARLPTMSAGRHVLELTTFVEGEQRLESSRSSAMTVSVGQAVMTSGPTAPATLVTADGIHLTVASLTAGLEDPTDFAVAPDGRVFISERAGRIRVFRDGRLHAPAVSIDDVVATDRRGLLALALDPDFDRTGHLFAVYTADAGFRLVRYRAAGDTLGDRAMLIDGIEATLAAPAAALRFGPDRKLYLAIDDAGDPSRPGDLGSYNGKVLRLNLDGTTPPDQAGGTPVYAMNVNQPRGMDWDGSTLWIAESLRLQGVAEVAAAAKRAVATVNYRLPAGTDPEGMAFYRGALIPGLTGDLLVASADGGSIVRLRFDPDNRRRIVSSEYVLHGVVGPIQAIAEGPNGAVYFCTMTELFIIVPEPGPAGPPRSPVQP
jgi:glucose/arabinose dehydrogenase